MQRVRVGLTGLAAVMLIVAVSTAIFESAKKGEEKATAPGDVRSEQVVANMLVNQSEAPSEPLAEIGVTPAAPSDSSADAPAAPAH